MLLNLRQRAGGDHAPAMLTRARPHVNDPIRCSHRVVVMLDHQHRVAEVAHTLERVNEALLVALMQPNRRLIQHIQHAHQLRADLRRQTNALAFAAAQGHGGTRQIQIIEADIHQKRQPRPHLFHNLRRNFAVAGREGMSE